MINTDPLPPDSCANEPDPPFEALMLVPILPLRVLPNVTHSGFPFKLVTFAAASPPFESQATSTWNPRSRHTCGRTVEIAMEN